MANVIVDLGYEVVIHSVSLGVGTGATELNVAPFSLPPGKRAVGMSAVHAPGGVRTSRIELYPTGPDPEDIGTMVGGKLRWESGEITSDTTVDLFIYVICIKV